MQERSDQVRAWKDVEARDADPTDHPSGEVRLPKQLSSARVAILAGYLGATGIVTNALPTIPSMSCMCGCGWG